MALDTEHMSIPENTADADAWMSAAELQKIVRDMSILSENRMDFVLYKN